MHLYSKVGKFYRKDRFQSALKSQSYNHSAKNLPALKKWKEFARGSLELMSLESFSFFLHVLLNVCGVKNIPVANNATEPLAQSLF